MTTKKIWKYEINSDEASFPMPEGTEILCVKMQNNTPCIWALINKDFKDLEIRTFITVGTGQDIKFPYKKYIGTFLMNDDEIVGHLFEV